MQNPWITQRFYQTKDSQVSFWAFVSSWMFQVFFLEHPFAAGVVLGAEGRKMSTLTIFASLFLTCLRVSVQSVEAECSSQKAIKSNPVLNFPFSKSDKKAKVN